MVPVHTGRLAVAVDRTAPGSEGRLCLTLPPELAELVGRKYRTLGNFTNDKVVTLAEHEDGLTVTPRRQVWWKNGVRDHGIRENWWVDIYVCTPHIVTVVLRGPTGEARPELPPSQQKLFI